MDNKQKVIIMASVVVILLISIPIVTFYVARGRQDVRSRAQDVGVLWSADREAHAECEDDGTVRIRVVFENDESCSDGSKAMNVIATDIQTGNWVDMGTVDCGETKEDFIRTNETVVDHGPVRFDLTWASGAPGSDEKFNNHSEEICGEPKDPTSTPEPPKPSGTPVLPTITPAATPTATSCPVPQAVQNVEIICPLCGG